MIDWPGFSLALLISARSLRFSAGAQKYNARLLRTVVLLILTIAVCHASNSQESIQVLSHHVRAEISNGKAALVGAMQSDEKLSVSIVLPLRNQAELKSLLVRLYDPSDPDYRKFLTVEQFADRFGPTTQDYQAVVSFAQANGLTVTGSYANRLVVPISGTVAQIDQAFNIRMNVYQHPTENRTFYAPDREPSLSLTAPVAHIEGLDNFSIPRPMLTQLPEGLQIANVQGSGPGGSYLASDMRAAYYGGTTLNGNGQVVGILEFEGYNLSDVNQTFSNAGQSYNVPVTNVLLNGVTGFPTSNNDAEAVLDIVQAIGMAPGLSQVRVYIGTNDADILSSMASENIAKQLSCSWSWQPADPAVVDIFFQEFAAQGQSFFTASGDDGAFDASVSPYFYPQEDAYVTAVGGTHLTTNGAGGSWISETAWNSNQYGSGGGISPDGIAIPSWQTEAPNSSNGGSTSLRNVPDVAMEADFDNYNCSMGSCSQGAAGTSFAAPRWAGFMALVNQQAVEAGTAPTGGLGFLNPSLYAIGKGANYGNDFHDATSGDNDTRSQPVWFNAVSGYDLVTGWGSANGQNLIDELAGPQVPGFWILGSPRVVSVNQGSSSSTTVTVTDAEGFSGNVTLAVTSALPDGVTASWNTNPTSGSSVLTLNASNSAAVSTTAVTITGTSGTFTATTTFTLAVHSPTFTLTASPSSLSINQGGSGTSTVTVAPLYGFSAAVNLSVTGLPSGVTATWGTNPTSTTSVLTLTASASAQGGTSTLTITGTSGSLTITTRLTITIQAPSFTLTSPGSVDFGLGGSGNEYIYINPQYGFSGSVNLAVSGLPSGVTASFSPNPTTFNSVLTLTANSSAVEGSSTITVTGTSGSLTATTTFTLTIHKPSFTLYSGGSISIGQGSTNSIYVSVNPQYGFTGSVVLSVSGLPSGVTALWNPNPTSGSSLLTLSASSSAAVGQYTLTITGTSGTLTASTTLSLGVFVPTFTLSGGGSVNVGQGASANTYVYVNQQYGFTGSVNLSVSGLPSGVTATFSPNPTTSSSTITFSASGSAPVGQYTLTVTGSSGTQSKTTTLTLGVFVPTFTLSGGGSVSVGQGASANTYVYVNQQYGFTGSVNLSVSGLPSGVTATFSPNPTTSSSTITFSASSSATVGQYTLTVTGSSGTQSKTTTLTLGVFVPTFTLSGGGSVSVGQGASANTYVYVNQQYGFTGSVNLSVSGLPSGVTGSFSPNPATGVSTLTLTASSSATLGQYTVTVTGTSGSQTSSTNFTLGVYVPSFTLSGPYSLTMGRGSSYSSWVNVFSQYGFSGNVDLSVSGLPSGVTASFSPNPATSYSNLTLTASSSTPVGQYTVSITGTSGSQTASTTFTLGIYDQSFSINASPNNLTANVSSSVTSTIFIAGQYGFNGNVNFSAANLPSGVTATFTPNPASSTSTMTLTTSGSTTPGTATVTIIGTSGSLSANIPITLTINAPNFGISDAPSAISLAPGGTQNSTIIVTPQYGFSSSVNLSVSDLPSGISATFTPNPATNSSTLKLTASSTASPGTTTLTVKGISGSIVATVPLSLAIKSASTTTTTALAVTSSGNPVTSIPSGTVVALTASVTGGAGNVTSGHVNFCESTATYCDDIHRVGTAQLASVGSAVLRFSPGLGAHSYKAVYMGTGTMAPSSSSPASLQVTSSLPTATAIAQSGSTGNYTLTATVVGGGSLSPSGTVTFVDTNNAGATVGSSGLAPVSSTLGVINSQTPPTGTNPLLVATADFNSDGIPDLAVGNTSTNNLTILLGKGDGTFVTVSTSPVTGAIPVFLATGDFNTDGQADLAVANQNGNSLTILLGNGDGTFTASPSSPQTGTGPTGIVVADLNGDGLQDLAVSNTSSNTLTVLLGNGDGTFTASPQSPQTGSNPKYLASGDFNGDGVQDLAVANYWSNTVSVFLGNGDGTFSPVMSPKTGNYPYSLAIGDFNGDGKPDLAVANAVSQTVTILLGNGDGTFTASGTSPQTGSQPIFVAVGNFNGDGNSDLAVANEYSNKVTILLGNGDGGFTAGPYPSTGTNPTSIAIADFNGDGLSDLAIANNWSGSITILTSQLTQSASATATGISAFGTGAHAVQASYSGDSNYRSSVSTTTSITGQVATPTVTLSVLPSDVTTTTPLSVTITVNGPSGAPTPSGTVGLSGGGYTSADTALTNGSAIITVPAGSLTAGTVILTAAYAGDANYSSGSATASVTVVTSLFTLSASTPAAITRGNSATSTITASSSTDYHGTVTLSCTLNSGGPANSSADTPVCSVPSSAMSIGGTATVTVRTQAAVVADIRQTTRPDNRRSLFGGGAVLAFLVMLGIPARRRSWQAMLGLLILFAAFGTLTACGGGSSSGSGNGGTTRDPGTASGTYTFTVSGTGNPAVAPLPTATFTVTVN